MENQGKIRDWMKRNVIYAHPEFNVRDAATLLVKTRVGTLPVVDETGTLLGVTSIRGIIQIFLPDFVSLLTDISFVKDYGALRALSPKDLERIENMKVADIMVEPIAVD